jgi:hypothetical protein
MFTVIVKVRTEVPLSQENATAKRRELLRFMMSLKGVEQEDGKKLLNFHLQGSTLVAVYEVDDQSAGYKKLKSHITKTLRK